MPQATTPPAPSCIFTGEAPPGNRSEGLKQKDEVPLAAQARAQDQCRGSIFFSQTAPCTCHGL